MLLNIFNEGKVRSKDSSLVQFFKIIPYLYVFKNDQLEMKIKFSGFNLSKREYNMKTQELFINFEDWSYLEDVLLLTAAI